MFAGSESVINYLMPPILASFHREHPRAVVEMESLDRSSTLEVALERGIEFVAMLRRHAVASRGRSSPERMICGRADGIGDAQRAAPRGQPCAFP